MWKHWMPICEIQNGKREKKLHYPIQKSIWYCLCIDIKFGNTIVTITNNQKENPNNQKEYQTPWINSFLCFYLEQTSPKIIDTKNAFLKVEALIFSSECYAYLGIFVYMFPEGHINEWGDVWCRLPCLLLSLDAKLSITFTEQLFTLYSC